MRRGLAGLAVMAFALAALAGGPAVAETKPRPAAKPAAAAKTSVKPAGKPAAARTAAKPAPAKSAVKPAPVKSAAKSAPAKPKVQKAAVRTAKPTSKAAAKTRPALLPPGTVRLNPVAWSAVTAPSLGPAQAIGGYASGCLAGGVALAPEGPGYQVIRLSRGRNYGHPVLVSFLEDFGRRVERQGLGTALVGDMGQPRGGPLSYGHASHQSGLDADVWLRLDLPAMTRGAREKLTEIRYVNYAGMTVVPTWSERQAALVRTAATDPRVARIFVNPAIKRELCTAATGDRDWLRKVRPWHGHDGHMHIRLSCPPGSPACEEQTALPDGDGCGDELASWLGRAVPAREIPPSKARPPSPALPAACAAVLQGAGTTLVQAGPAGGGVYP